MSLAGDYWLPRGGEEAQRLNYQHGLLTRTAGYVIHPTIWKSLPPNAKIADVGSGTAVWLLDIAHFKQLTDPEFYAFDISDKQFEAPDDQSIRISFNVQDATRGFPDQFRGLFDLVHLRFIATGLQVADYKFVVSNMIDLLKPGGAIQWQEARFDEIKVFQPSADAPPSVLRRTFDRLTENIGKARFAHAPLYLADYFKKAGLVNVDEHVTSNDHFPEDRKPYSLHMVNTWKSGVDPKSRISRVGPSIEEIEQLCDQMHAEIEDGAYIRFDNHTIIGFKPQLASE